jgi:hypothetical protein
VNSTTTDSFSLTVHYSTHWDFSVYCVFTGCRPVTASNVVNSWVTCSFSYWPVTLSQLTKHHYGMAYNNGSSSASYISTRGGYLTTAWFVCLFAYPLWTGLPVSPRDTASGWTRQKTPFLAATILNSHAATGADCRESIASDSSIIAWITVATFK